MICGGGSSIGANEAWVARYGSFDIKAFIASYLGHWPSLDAWVADGGDAGGVWTSPAPQGGVFVFKGSEHYASATATPVSPEAAAVMYARTQGDAIMAAHQAAVAELSRRAEGDELAMQAIRMSAAMLHLALGMVGGHQEAREAAESILGKLAPQS